jgi:hypothetical protein
MIVHDHAIRTAVLLDLVWAFLSYLLLVFVWRRRYPKPGTKVRNQALMLSIAKFAEAGGVGVETVRFRRST